MPNPSSSSHHRRVGFAGTPEFARGILAGLLAEGISPTVVLTAPARPSGRGRKRLPTPVAALATSRGLPVLTPTSLRNPELVRSLAGYALDLLIVAAYGLILPKGILEQPRFGCLNIHPSLLPRWRGAAPIERAIMAGDTETGLCIMQMDEGLDTGPLIDIANFPILEDATGDALRDALTDLGVRRLLAVLKALPSLRPQPQAPTGITYAEKITRSDQKIDWGRSAQMVSRQVHALNSAAPAFSQLETRAETYRVRFLRVKCLACPEGQRPGAILDSEAGSIHIACGTGCVSILEASVLRGAGRRLSARELTNGFPHLFRPGNYFLSRG